MKPDSIEWFIKKISNLPSDKPVAYRTPGYNNYMTQKDHWLGWIDPNSNTGTYQRASRPDRDARYVYNHIMEPKMLLWLASASGVNSGVIEEAMLASENASSFASRSAAVRKIIPWAVVSAALSALESEDG
ncbi:hypothetical protein ACUH78_17890 [Thauera sp. ZXT1-4]|uniref:hypothetical protein n=1 Tax=Thauera sp. ZXT1-4 TaxID=3460294 RepID=UPI0040409C43